MLMTCNNFDYSPLNLYLVILWILDFKYILLLCYVKDIIVANLLINSVVTFVDCNIICNLIMFFIYFSKGKF